MTDEEKKLKEAEIEDAQVADTGTDTDKKSETDTETATSDSAADPDTDTGDKPDTDTEPAISDEQEAFNRLGLSGQFVSPVDALNRMPDFNRHIDHLNKRNLTLEQELAEARKTKPVPLNSDQFRDKFDENPLDALDSAGLAKKEDVESLQTEIQRLQDRDNSRNFADSLSEYPELKNVVSAYRIGRTPVSGMNPYWDKMKELMSEYPGLETASPEVIVKILLPHAKKLVNPGQKPPVGKVSDADKAGANSPSPGKTARTTTPDYSNMTSDQIMADMRKRGQVNY